MTKSTITRERIQRIIRAIDSEAYDEEEIREWLSSDEIMELARIVLAAMNGEPVAITANIERDAQRYRFLRERDAFGDDGEPGLASWDDLIELDTNDFDAAIDARMAHPSVDFLTLDNALQKHERRRCKDRNCNKPIYGYSVDGLCEDCYATVSQQPAPEHPEVLPCSVLLEPGLRFGKGIKTSTMLAALARRPYTNQIWQRCHRKSERSFRRELRISNRLLRSQRRNVTRYASRMPSGHRLPSAMSARLAR